MTAGPVVWITRPQPGAARTAAALAEAGYEPFLMPLTEIRAVDPGLSGDDVSAVDAVAVTSANALRHLPKALLDRLRDKPLYAVGDATAAEAEASGFSAVASADGAVDDLAALISAREKEGATVLYLGGLVRTGDLEGKLVRNGLRCVPIEVYSSEKVSYMTDIIANALKRHAPGAILFHSRLSVEAFSETALAQFPHAFDKTSFFAISERVSQALSGDLKMRTIVADEPTERSMLAMLRRTLPADPR